MENEKVKTALQIIYDELENAKESNKKYEVTNHINEALSALLVITEELQIEITI